MNVELGKLADGGLVIMCDSALPHNIHRVEYYRDQRLMLLVYDDADHEGDLMHYELSDIAVVNVEKAPTIMIVDHSPGHKLYGYDVALIHV